MPALKKKAIVPEAPALEVKPEEVKKVAARKLPDKRKTEAVPLDKIAESIPNAVVKKEEEPKPAKAKAAKKAKAEPKEEPVAAITVNVNVDKKESKGAGVPDQVDRQGGRVNTIVNGERRIGLSKGATINMGNYESARVDVWMERVVPDNDHDMKVALEEMSNVLNSELEEEVKKLAD
jgi:hypothetical protein